MITAHMVVKNEDKWVWFAIKSVLPYVDKFLITDTGSLDNTVKLIKSIKSDKIEFDSISISSAKEITKVRQSHLDKTKDGWIWLVDGDEIYSKDLATKIKENTKKNYSVIVVKRFDLLGDIYHRQKESVGEYELYGSKGHLVTRLINTNTFKGLHVSGDYPLEGYFDSKNVSTRKINPKKAYITKGRLYHAMYLKRSSLNDKSVFNRGKYKIETGKKIAGDVPEVFQNSPDSFNLEPLRKRGWLYEFLAILITPIKNIKRKLVGTRT